MEAKDTVMGVEALWDIEEAVEDAVFSGQGADLKPLAVAKAQAEITWKIAEQAGIKKVVEWIREHNAEPDEILDTWRAQLKEWGIKPHENAQD